MAVETINLLKPGPEAILDEEKYLKYYEERDKARAEDNGGGVQDEAQESEARREQTKQQVEATYQALANNASEAKNEELANVLAKLAELAGKEVTQIFENPKEVTDKQRDNDRPPLIPDRPRGSLIDFGNELPDAPSHIIELAVGVARALMTEGENDITLCDFDLTNEQVKYNGMTQVFPQASVDIQTQFSDALIMLGANKRTQINDQSAGNNSASDVYHHETNLGGLMVKETVRYKQLKAKGRSDGATLVDRNTPVSLTLSLVRTPVDATPAQMNSVPAPSHPALARPAA